MKILFLLVLSVFFSFPLNLICQNCLPFDGFIESQIEVDYINLVYPDCSVIDGSLWITGDVTNLDSLYRIKKINGSLNILSTKIKDISGLNQIDSIKGYLHVRSNTLLESITGLRNVTYLSSVVIDHNESLKEIATLDSVRNVGNHIIITENPELKSIHGLNNVATCRNIEISNHDSLTMLNAFNGVVNVEGQYKIFKNNALKSWTTGTNVKFIKDNLSLSTNASVDTITGFDKLMYCKNLYLSGLKVKHLNNFNELEKTEYISIFNRYTLLSLDGFNSLKYCDRVAIQSNSNLKSIDGFNALDSAGTIYITGGLSGLESINGFNKLQYAEDIFIQDNYNIKQFTAFANLKRINYLYIDRLGGTFDNFNNFSNLTDIDNKLTIIRMINDLNDLSGFKNVNYKKLKVLNIYNNKNISMCNIYSICKYLEENSGISNIYDNKPGCYNRDEILESCRAVNTDDYKDIHLSLYPNPTSGILNFETPNNETIDLRIYNSLGQEINFSRNGKNVDISNQKSGIYYVNYSHKSIRHYQKIVLLR